MRFSAGISRKQGPPLIPLKFNLSFFQRFMNVWQAAGELYTVDLGSDTFVSLQPFGVPRNETKSAVIISGLSPCDNEQLPVLRIASVGNVVGCLKQGRRPLVVRKDLVVEV